MIFCGDLQNVDGLRAAGFDLMSTANNHAENYGVQGVRQTRHTLGVNGITAFGDPVVGTYQLGGSHLAILGFDDVSRHLDLGQVASVVRRTADSGALTLVYFHWGQEYQVQESARQRELAHVSIEAGAAAVIGAHPHVVQGSEWYQGKPIYYSLGNFVFDQEWSRETKQGLAIRLHLRDNQITRVDELPVLIQSYGQPTWLPGVLR
jgi:poly-gamma-glutamate synthesis protein (capsule biosynthesis protein)